MELFAGKFDDGRHITGIHLCGFGLLHFADDLCEPRFFHGSAHGVLNLHDKGFVLRVQSCLGVDAEIFLAICNTPHMVTAGGGFIHDHAVAAHQPIDQRLDADGTKSDLAVADDDPCLHNVAGGYLRLQAGVHGLDVHTAFGDLAAFKADVRQPAENRKRHSGNVDIVDAAVAIAQVRTGGAVQGAQHTLAVFLLEPCVGVVGQQVGAFLPHTVIVGGGDAQMSADLPMGDAGDGHGLD